jgi:ABC-type lipoprotein export system ATPase subunit
MHRLIENLSRPESKRRCFCGTRLNMIDFRQADRRQRVPDVVQGYHLSSDRITRDNVAIE